MDYFSIHRTAIVWVLGTDVPGCVEQRLLRVVRIFDCVTGRDGRRTFISAMKYHAEYDQGQLTSCKLTWLNWTRSKLSTRELVRRALPCPSILSFITGSLCKRNPPILHHDIQLVCDLWCSISWRWWRRNGWPTVQDILDRFQKFSISKMMHRLKRKSRSNAYVDNRGAAFEWSAAQQHQSPSVCIKLVRGMVIYYQTQGRRRVHVSISD